MPKYLNEFEQPPSGPAPVALNKGVCYGCSLFPQQLSAAADSKN